MCVSVCLLICCCVYIVAVVVVILTFRLLLLMTIVPVLIVVDTVAPLAKLLRRYVRIPFDYCAWFVLLLVAIALANIAVAVRPAGCRRYLFTITVAAPAVATI